MLLVVDIGNTQITMGMYDRETLLFVSNIATQASHTGDQYAVELKNIMALHDFGIGSLSGAILSSVVPAVGVGMTQAIERLYGVKPMVIGPGIKTGLNIKVESPALLGGDLVVAAVAAGTLYPLPAIVFDFGTATKISVVGHNNCYLGCAITSGINISIDALAARTATLPSITAETPKSLIGTNSAESMKAGLIFGAAAMVDGMAERIEEELGERASLVLTGGLAHLVRGYCRRHVIYHGHLLLEGLRMVYNKNR